MLMLGLPVEVRSGTKYGVELWRSGGVGEWRCGVGCAGLVHMGL